MYRVMFNRAYEEPRHIATADKFAEALAAAKRAGALLHEGKGGGQGFVFAVSGHEGDHDFVIRIEKPMRSSAELDAKLRERATTGS